MRLSLIDDELSIYKKNKIIIYGAGRTGIKLHNLLSSFGIRIDFFCDKNPKLQSQEIHGITVISPEELETKYSGSHLVQIGSVYEAEIKRYLNSIGISNYITYTEADIRLNNLKRYRFSKKDPESFDYYLKNQYSRWNYSLSLDKWDKILHPGFEDSEALVLILNPPRTGDHTVLYTVERYNNNIIAVILSHTASMLTGELRKVIGRKPIKIVTAVREPVSQNLSSFYHGMDYWLWNYDSYWKNGGDVNAIFEQYITDCKDVNEGVKNTLFYTMGIGYKEYRSIPLIQSFFEMQFQQKLNIDIFKYPFDKEAGYSIIKAEGVEIFIYQLEKLNRIYDKLFDFLNIRNDSKLINGSRAENEYYSEYYKDAVQNIQFSKSYFDFCYDAPYVKHFYSEEDIERFKDKWRSHIL